VTKSNIFSFENIFLVAVSRGTCQSRCAGAGFDSFKNLHKNILLYTKKNKKKSKKSEKP